MQMMMQNMLVMDLLVVTCEKAIEVEKTNNPSIHSLNNEMLLLSEIALLATNHLTHRVVPSLSIQL